MIVEFQFFDDLAAFIQVSLNNSLENEVADIIRATMVQHVDSDVYRRYSPVDYNRRGTHGGLSDPANIISEIVSDGLLVVENSTEFNRQSDASKDSSYHTDNYGWELAGLIEYGDGWNGYYYDYPTRRSYMQPRPFIANTRKEVEQKKLHIKAIKQGLKARGVRFK